MKKTMNLRFWVVALLLLSLLGCDSTEMTSAKVYLQQKNYEKAEEMLLLAFEKEPLNPEPAFLLAVEIYARNKNWDKFSEFLTKSETIGPKFTEKIKQAREKYWVDNFNAGANGYNALIGNDVKNEEEVYASTIKSFENCILINPEKPETYSTLAQVYLFKEDFDNGTAYMIKAIEYNPNDIPSLVNLGNVYFRNKQYDEALTYLKKAIEVDPSNLNAIKQIAFVYDAKGEKEQAAVAYLNAIEKDPESADLHYNLGVLYFQQEEYEKAASEFIKVIEFSPTEVDAAFNAGLAFEKLKKYKEAETYLAQAYEMDPTSVDIVHELKLIYYHVYGMNSKQFKELYKVEKSLK